MICPKCGCHDRVTRTITDRKTGETRRYRRCPKCGHQAETVEKPVTATEEPQADPPKKPSRKKRQAKPPATEAGLKGALAEAMSGAAE